MTKMNDEDKRNLFEKYTHLRKYVENVREKIGEPIFYTTLPFEAREEAYPNLIYATKGSVFVHIFRTKDMNEIEYRAIEPSLSEIEKKKYGKLLNSIVKLAPNKKK